MYKRQRILLGILLDSPKEPTHAELMSWVFLLKRETCLSVDRSFYEFVPYRYGPFSFTVYRDLEELARLGYLNGKGNSISSHLLAEAQQAFQSLPFETREETRSIVRKYGSFSKKAMAEHLYKNYPWFATRNSPGKTAKPLSDNGKTIFTAGYEGQSIDLFLQKILKAQIERVLDVRSNPVSRKYGFSKRTLALICGKVGVEYIHLPELGIPPSYRASLKTGEDYRKLLRKYDCSILPKASKTRDKAIRLAQERPSVLICFEADTSLCHRTRLAQTIASHATMDVVHL